MEKLTTLLKKVQDLNSDKKYYEVIELLPIEILEKHNNADLYAEKAAAFGNLKRYNECEIMAQKAIEIDKNSTKAYNSLGNISLDFHNDYIKAEENYRKTIEINPKLPHPYNGIGNIYCNLKEFEKAKEYYLKAIEIEPKFYYSYNGLGGLYHDLEEYEKAKEYYLKSIEIEPNYDSPYYNLGFVSYDLLEYDSAKKYFTKYIQLNDKIYDFYYKIALSKIEEINKILDNSSYKTITELVSKIKEILLFKGECVTHYSSISATQYLILKDSPLRLSEGSFLNDTSEGQELFDFLAFSPEVKTKCHEETFTKRPFIGSFVDILKRNDLTLWRMYGKEALEEAKGCSITLNVNELKQSINAKIKPSEIIISSKSDEIEFYRVAYRSNGSFHFAGATPSQTDEFSKLMDELKKEAELFKSKTNKNPNEEVDIIELLNSIAYLFKSVEYQYENEIRLVINEAIGFDIKIDLDSKDFKPSSKPNKVYIELVPISGILKDITIGPKVDRAEEWASTFHYHLLSQGLKPEIHISKLPFK
ncbi:hypothetical protein GCM10011514_55010 [Emticicia aquatilis]|uniref:Tetratricopeptide repeat protein n=1 Tax=Emticicia aquatilis TaxID=1537369 RepID=A0A917E0C2_9BACT|nr:tetratricopeptide repeat protein [Emticicia aquatilis]GGD84019.1 hypothetical protein GCM10011514_55010 [Emticicia aquatilis]